MRKFVYITSAKNIAPVIDIDKEKWAHILIIILDLITASNYERNFFLISLSPLKHLLEIYYDITPESLNSGVRLDVHC
jgi:hypothetical protein